MISQRVLCRRFIGRVAELDHVADFRRRAASMHGGGVIVLGEAGIGKSRLVREYRERYCARSYTATGVCREFGQRAFEPLAEITSSAPTGRARSTRGGASKDEQLATIVAAVGRATSRRMTTIIVEDIHWAQVELLQTLAALVQWGGESPAAADLHLPRRRRSALEHTVQSPRAAVA